MDCADWHDSKSCQCPECVDLRRWIAEEPEGQREPFDQEFDDIEEPEEDVEEITEVIPDMDAQMRELDAAHGRASKP